MTTDRSHSEVIAALEVALEAYEAATNGRDEARSIGALMTAATPDALRALLDAHASALRDAERLDWLEKNSAEDVDDAQLWACWPAEHDRLRDAIDSARTAMGANTKGAAE